MGAMLPKPVGSTIVERKSSKDFYVGVAEMNGWRSSMEDAHLIEISDSWGFFGVFDGHGGAQCSRFVANSIGAKLQAGGCPKDDAAVKELILNVDQEFLATENESGSTATMCIIHKPERGGKHKLRVANAGDSRVLLGRRDGSIVDGGGTDKGLTRDHKPSDASEKERIYRCGGYVEQPQGGVARVNGDLAVSRGFGDVEYKKTGGPGPEDRPVTADPELGHFECGDSDFVLLVCDGVSEGDFSNEEVVQLVASCLKEKDDPGFAAKAVCHAAVAKNSKDNITCMVVLLSGLDETHELEFNPGPLIGMDNRQFMTAWGSMAEKAHVSLEKAIEKRYCVLQEKLKHPDGPFEAPDIDYRELKHEAEMLGVAPGPQGSEAWNEFFKKKAQASKDEDSGNDGITGLPAGLANLVRQHPFGSELLQREMMQRFGPGAPAGGNQRLDAQAPINRCEETRKVRVTDLASLKTQVEEHPQLTWDKRMTQLADEEGSVSTVDDSDGTSYVKFAAPINLGVWLPTLSLTDV